MSCWCACRLDALTNGIVVVPHRSVGVPTSLGEVAWDALPELDEIRHA